MVLTEELARAAAADAASRRARKAGRLTWDRADYQFATEEFNRLWPMALVSADADRVQAAAENTPVQVENIDAVVAEIRRREIEAARPAHSTTQT